MHRLGVVALVCLFTWPRGESSLARANPANGDPRKEKLFSLFIAPCCWRENLLMHHSPKADELRAEIERLIAGGSTDEEIKRAFVEKHSLRVLALPEGARAGWLWWMPPAAAFCGLLGLVFFIHRSRRHPAAEAARDLPPLPELEDLP